MKRLLMRAMRALWSWLFAALLLSGCAHAANAAHVEGAQAALQGETLYRTGVQLADAGDLTRGEQYLSAALRTGYAPVQTLKALLGTCVRAGRLRSAISYATPRLADHPQETGLRLLVASLHFALQEHSQAEQQLRALLRQHEPSAEAHYLLALLLHDADRERDEARAHFQRYLELSPQGRHADEARAWLAPAPATQVARKQRG